MKFRVARPSFAVLLPCVGVLALGVWTAAADPTERTGADAPHQERNEAKNEKKSALPLSELNVPSDKPVRRAIAVKSTSNSRKAKDKKKADQQAKAKSRTEATPADEVDERPRYNYSQAEDRVGSDAPHQERNSDPGKSGARLIIIER